MNNNLNGFAMSPPPGPSGGYPLGMPAVPGPHDGPGLDAFHQFVRDFEGRQTRSRQEAEHLEQELRRVRHERDESYDAIVHMYKQLLDKFTQKCEDFDNEVVSRRNWHREANEYKRQIDQLELAAESSPFAAVIIDGDGAVFTNELLAKGHEGGVEAAHLLLSNIKNQLKNIYPKSNIDDWSIVVQVALSLPGLGKKLTEVGIIQNVAQLADFVHGFNYSQALFSIVDVGKGNQRADGKCREMARLMAKVKQCKHLFFGPCHDLGYIPALQALRDPYGATQRLTLVESVPALPGFRELNLPFTKFTVFRSEPLPIAAPRAPPVAPSKPLLLSTTVPTVTLPAASRSSQPPTPGASVVTPSSAETPTTAGGSNGASWADMSKNGVHSTIDIAPAKKPVRKYYLINIDGERVDEPLPKSDPAAEKRYFARRKAEGSYCNDYYLKNNCDQAYCKHVHGPPLGNADLLVIRHKGRSLPCSNEGYCTDPDCYYGHVCRYGRHCQTVDCRFKNLHYVNTTPAYRIYEDGAEEKVP